MPLFLLNAFTRLANAYFLMVCVLQSVPSISITNGVPTSLLPLGIVLLFDGTATAREDYKRHVDDAAANNSKSAFLTPLRARSLAAAPRGSALTPSLSLLAAPCCCCCCPALQPWWRAMESL